LIIKDENGKAYRISARGDFYVTLDPTAPEQSAVKFYQNVILANGFDELKTDQLILLLRNDFANRICVLIQEYIEENNIPISTLKSLGAGTMSKMSEYALSKLDGLFERYALVIDKKLSRDVLISSLVVFDIDD
jgi:hypothetical protein